jgi:hypothetical protein
MVRFEGLRAIGLSDGHRVSPGRINNLLSLRARALQSPCLFSILCPERALLLLIVVLLSRIVLHEDSVSQANPITVFSAIAS